MPKEPVLFTRCENDDAFTRPVLGTGLAKTGTPTYDTGYFGNGLKGTNNAYWLCEPVNIFSSGNNQKGTIALWYKPTVGFNAASNTIYYFGTNVAGTCGQYMVITAAGATLRFNIQIFFGVNINIDFPTTSLNVGVWYHFAQVWDFNGIDGSSDTVRIYKNGVDVGSSAVTLAVKTWPAACGGIGNYYHAPTQPTIGIIDNFKIYDYTKTDFSDMLDERGSMNDLESVT